MPHIGNTISVGDLLMILTVLGGLLGALRRFEKVMAFFRIEHEILINDYCQRHNMEPSELPTRSTLNR